MAVNDNEARVRIVADASGVQPGVDVAKGEIAGLQPFLEKLAASFAEVSTQIKASLGEIEPVAKEAKAALAGVNAATEKETLSLKEMALKIHEGAESVRTFQMRAKEFAEVYVAMFALEQIADWVKEFAEAREQVEHLAETFGMTTNQVQQFGAIAKLSGISLETITRGMQILDRNAITAATSTGPLKEAFKAVGLSANDGMTQMERMYSVADKFANMADGPKKAALAMELFGRSGAQLIPVLNLGSEGLKKMTEEATEFDVANTAVSESAQKKGEQLAESINTSKLAFSGLANMLGDAFAPVLIEIVDKMNSVIKAMIDSYNSGGVVERIFKGIAVVVEDVVAVIEALAEVFKALWDAVVEIVTSIADAIADCFGNTTPAATNKATDHVNQFKAAMVILKDVVIAVIAGIEGAILELIDYLRTFAVVTRDAFTLNWGAIDADWKAGTARIANDVATATKRIHDSMAEATAAMHGKLPETKSTGIETRKGGEGEDFDPDLGGRTGRKKKPRDDLVQKLEEELTAKKTAWAMEQDAQGTAQQYSLQSESQFWADALQMTDLSAKDRLAIEQKYLAAHGKLTEEEIKKQIGAFSAKLEAAKGDSAERMKIATDEAEYLKREYGEESAQYASAQKQIRKIKEENEQQLRQLSDETAKELEKQQTDAVAAEESAAKFRVSLGLSTQSKLIAQERQFEDARYQIQAQALEAQQKLIDPLHDPVKYQKLSDQILDLERQHQAKITQIDQQAILQRTLLERNAITSTANLWGQNIAKMLTLQQSFSATVRSLYTGMVGVISTALASIIEKWLEQQLAALLLKRTAQTTDGVATVTSNAGVAASAAFASTAAIPIVGPELAPAAAAAAFSATMAFAPIASAAGGMGYVPYDDMPFLLHREEMVLPASLANPFRNLLQSNSNDNAAPVANDRGGDHYHIHAVDAASFQKLLMANAPTVGAAVRKHVRNGGSVLPN